MTFRGWTLFLMVAGLSLVLGVGIGSYVARSVLLLPGSPSDIHQIIPRITEIRPGGDVEYSLEVTWRREECHLGEIVTMWEYADGARRQLETRMPAYRAEVGARFITASRVTNIPADISEPGHLFVSLRYECPEGRRSSESPRMAVRFSAA